MDIGAHRGSAISTADVGRRIAQLRREHGLSLSRLAAQAGIGKATLSGVEAGTRNPTLETLYAITGQLGLPLAAVLADRVTPSMSHSYSADARLEVHGDAVRARLLTVFEEPDVIFEYYDIRIHPGPQQFSPAHPPGTTEHLTVFAGWGVVGPREKPVPLQPGAFVTWDADQPHLFHAEEEIIGALVIRTPRTPRPPEFQAGDLAL